MPLHGDRLTAIQGDVTDSQAVEQVIATGYDAIILGAAITAGPAREASDPETILRVNLLAQTPILIAARTQRRQAHHQSVVRGSLRRERIPERAAR